MASTVEKFLKITEKVAFVNGKSKIERWVVLVDDDKVRKKKKLPCKAFVVKYIIILEKRRRHVTERGT